MKLLQIHAEFKLPDNFAGSLSDALRLLAEYVATGKANERKNLNTDQPAWLCDKNLKVGDWETNALERLIDKNAENGSHTVLCYYVGDY